MKLDTFQGKRKVKDRWSEVEYVVTRQVINDMHTYEVKDDGRNVKVTHCNRLFLVAPMRDAATPLGGSESISYVGATWSTLVEFTPLDPVPLQLHSTWVSGWHSTAAAISGPETNSMRVKIW